MYDMSMDDLLISISAGLKKGIAEEELKSDEIKLSYLKKIDKIFKKGIEFYIDPKDPIKTKEASIFFRKQKFNSDLNLGAKKIVSHFEDFKISLTAIASLTGLNLERKFPVYSINKNPEEAAREVRKVLNPKFVYDKKEFLKILINSLADHNILVLEFVETWNKLDKANIDGFFLSPNTIVLKRQQTSLRREIFTLIHELGHFLLNVEEVEKIDYNDFLNKDLSNIERWCNDFAFYFLVNNYNSKLNDLSVANEYNDYHLNEIEQISKNTHLSKLAIYTRLLFNNKISKTNYKKIKSDLEEQFKIREAEIKHQRELDKLKGLQQGGQTPKPITSPLLISTIQAAYYEGVISEYEACKKLNIKSDKFESLIE